VNRYFEVKNVVTFSVSKKNRGNSAVVCGEGSSWEKKAIYILRGLDALD
jgi:hypothetical protein